MATGRALKLLFVLTAVSLSVSAAAPAQAQSVARTPGLAHASMKGEDLPSPGVSMPLRAVLLNSKDSQLQVRALIARDGKLIDVSLPDLSSDEHDRIVYSATVPAPRAEMTYQFFVMQDGKVLHASDRYSVRRPCLPDTVPVDTSIGLNGEARSKIETLRDYASRLSVEVNNLEQVIDMIEVLEKMTERPNG